MNKRVDFGKTSHDYAQHREGFPSALLSRLQIYGIGLAGQQLIDLGTGTGTLARQFAQQGCDVTGLDTAPEQLEQAHKLDQASGVLVHYRVGNAEDLPFDDQSVDVVTAGQCWHWFDASKVARECLRILKPGGVLVICHFDWLPLQGNVVELTESLILKHNPQWAMAGGTGFYPRWLSDVSVNGFQHLETFSFDCAVSYTHERWRGRIRASAGVQASLDPEQVRQFDLEHRLTLQQHFPHDPLTIPHRVWALIARKPS